MSFASEPGRDDNLPPVNVKVPDDARELDRDVLAYRREVRARRRRTRALRLVQPFAVPEFGGRGALLIPLIAVCLAVSLVGGALLSVMSMGPASAPTLGGTTVTPAVTGPLTSLPPGNVQLKGTSVPARSLVTSVIALVPAGCAACGPQLQQLAAQAATTPGVKLYFAGAGDEITQLPVLTSRYGGGTAVAVADSQSVLTGAFRPKGLTVLLVFHDATALVVRQLPADFELTAKLRQLGQAGAAQR